MKDIIFYDSGVGGIALLNKTRKLCGRENFLYFADNLNMPYGSKPQSEVLNLVTRNLENHVKTTTKCVVIACNTITSKHISEIRKVFCGTAIFGIEPEIKWFFKGCNSPTLLIATPQTCDALQGKLQKENGKITLHPAKTLAATIERNIGDKEVIYREIKKIKQCYPQKFSNVILGCTHYALVKEVFSYAFGEDVRIFDGINGTATNISNSIKKEDRGFGGVKLHLTKDTVAEKLKYVSLIN